MQRQNINIHDLKSKYCHWPSMCLNLVHPLYTQVDLPHRDVWDPSVQKRCGEALALMNSAWQRADSLARGRAQREPWC